MNSGNNHDPLGYVDDLRDVMNSPFMQMLFSTRISVGNSTQGDDSEPNGYQDKPSKEHGLKPTIAKSLPEQWDYCTLNAEQSLESRSLSSAVVAALGYCRIYGIELPADLLPILHTPLPIELLAPAIVEMLRMVESATHDAKTLPARFDDSEPLEDRSLCSSLLHSVMELWAMYLVVDDEYQYRIDHAGRHDPSFSSWMHRLLDAFSSLDSELQRDEQMRLLSVATELPLLENWRKMLVQEYRQTLPWWLDGTLEEVAAEVHRDIMSESLLGQSDRASSFPEVDYQASIPFTSYSMGFVPDFVLAASPSGLLGEVVKIVVKAASELSIDALGVLRDLEIDEPRLRTNPVWCLDQLSEKIPFPALKRQLLDVFVKYQVFIPAAVVEEILKDEKGI